MNEYLDLAAQALEIESDDPQEIEQAMQSQWGIGAENWEAIVDSLLPLAGSRHEENGDVLHYFAEIDPSEPSKWTAPMAYLQVGRETAHLG